ncbi:MAG: T9SS type A sorting domain-containing protein, partial [Bacteroidales bacterium]
INLTSGTLTIDKNLTLNNSNHPSGISISGSGDNITINTGKKLTIAGNGKITVIGAIKNNAGISGLQIESGASFIQNNINLAATVKRELSNKWHLFGSPFKKNLGNILANITPIGGSIQLKLYTNGTDWITNVTSPNYYLLPTQGYAVKPNITFTASLSGNLYYSPTSFDYTNTLVYNGTSSIQSWNLMANPYTSYLDWKLLGKTNLNNSLYLWDNTLYPTISPVANATYFRTFNAQTGVGVPSGTLPFIAPFQGFFVKAISTNPKLSFPPSARVHNTATYYKEASITEILLRLKTETDEGIDELVICKNPDAKLDFEGFDAEKMFNGNPLEMYTQSTTGERLVINTINTTTQTVIPLGINGNAGKKAKITAFALETSENVYLEDRFKGKLISLSENTTYEFEFPTDHIMGRFFIRFGDINTALQLSDVKVFENDNMLNIIAQTGENIEMVEVFTITGASVYKTDAGSNMLTAKLDLTTGVYLVRVKTNIGIQNVKVNWR